MARGERVACGLGESLHFRRGRGRGGSALVLAGHLPRGGTSSEPWLLAVEKLSPALLEQISRLEAIAPAVSWIIGPQDLQGLAQLLRLCMQMGLPDGRTALLRFWDPRVLAAAARDLKAAQRHTLFGHLFEWHLLLDGRRVHIGRPT